MRKSEALALTWNDIDFDKSQITINKTLILTPKVEVSTRFPCISRGDSHFITSFKVFPAKAGTK